MAAKPKAGKLVRQDADGIWLVASLAAQKSGLTKPELARRALAGALRFQADDFGLPKWYAEPQITALANDKAASDRAKPARAKRPPTDAQINARFGKKTAHVAIPRAPERLGPVVAHYEKVMLTEIAENNRKNKDIKGAGDSLLVPNPLLI